MSVGNDVAAHGLAKYVLTGSQVEIELTILKQCLHGLLIGIYSRACNKL